MRYHEISQQVSDPDVKELKEQNSRLMQRPLEGRSTGN